MSGNPWTISINYGPDGEQNYANVFDGDEWLVGNLRIHHANAVVTAVNSYASSQAEIERLRTALEVYANPEIYKPHPDGPAFDRRDVSYVARSALEGK
jgi:hypothetical protein